ncbi:hypothetical protein Tco_0205764 [Tanacetum coccineum]
MQLTWPNKDSSAMCHLSKEIVTRKLLIGPSQQMGFLHEIKLKGSTKGFDTRIATLQSVCSLNDPTVKIKELMIGSKQGPGLIGASNRLGDLETSSQAYK